MEITKGEFRFAYFTSIYEETCNFYSEKLNLNLEFSWNRSESDKGSVFRLGFGLVEVLQAPKSDKLYNSGLDYRSPQGAFMVIRVSEVDKLYKIYTDNCVVFKQAITNQSWGHRSFSLVDPNGVVLFFYEELG